MEYNFENLKDIDRSNFVRHNPVFLKSIFGKADVLPFWVADTDFEVMSELKEALVSRAENGHFNYETKSRECKKSISDWYSSRYGIKFHPKSLLFTPSVNASIAAIIDEFTTEGDGVIIQPPVYQAFAGIISGLNRNVVESPLIFDGSTYKMDFDDLEEKISRVTSKIFLLCSPHNPVGRVWEESELTKVAEICSRNNILIITDDIHCDVVYEPNHYVGMLKVYGDHGENIIMVSSAGKSFGIPGLVDSFITTPNQEYQKKLKERIEKFHLDKGNAFANTALHTVYKHGELWLTEFTNYLNGNIDYIDNFLNTEINSIKLIKPEGSYQVWIDFRALGMSNEELGEFLSNKVGIAVNQGFTYGTGGDGFVRMNIACPRKIIEQAMNQLKMVMSEN